MHFLDFDGAFCILINTLYLDKLVVQFRQIHLAILKTRFVI